VIRIAETEHQSWNTPLFQATRSKAPNQRVNSILGASLRPFHGEHEDQAVVSEMRTPTSRNSSTHLAPENSQVIHPNMLRVQCEVRAVQIEYLPGIAHIARPQGVCLHSPLLPLRITRRERPLKLVIYCESRLSVRPPLLPDNGLHGVSHILCAVG
jgi:hypothetical protein